MSRTSILILLGVLIILAPFSGLPVGIRSFSTVVLGACVAIIGLMVRGNEAKGQRASASATLSPSADESPAPELASPPSGVSPI